MSGLWKRGRKLQGGEKEYGPDFYLRMKEELGIEKKEGEGMNRVHDFHLFLWGASALCSCLAFTFAVACLRAGARGRGIDGLESPVYRALRFWGMGAVVMFVLAMVL